MIELSRRGLLAVAIAAASTPLSAWAQARRITIGANPPGTDYFTVGGGLAKLFGDKLGVSAIVQPYAGSSVYLPLIENGEVVAGLSSSLDSGGAYLGKQGRSPMPGLRALMRLWPLIYGYIARGDSGLKTIADLKGKRVMTEIKANVALTEANAAILATAGLSFADVTRVSVGGLPQGIQALQDGTLDAAASAVGIAAVREASAAVPGGLRWLDISGSDATTTFLEKRLPGTFIYPISPTPLDAAVVQHTNLMGFDIFLVVSETLKPDLAKAMLGAVWDGWDQLAQDYPPLRRGKREEIGKASNTVPYHAAAIEFFREKKIWTDTNDAREKGFKRA
ncbi:MAG TPA: TAXI family TRAP transporter solute-binding subunit [Stellaceae bacterium]|nr:TAXI family TRAP transporter solute-binding subunit [Stellaceae bacterium]